MIISEQQIKQSDFLNGLREYQIRYGDNWIYTLPFSPIFIILSEYEKGELEKDLIELSNLYSVATDLYLISLNNSRYEWIRECVESNLSPYQIIATQITSKNKNTPEMTRVDYICCDNDYRKIAEIQWKSGGPGFLIGHDLIYRKLFQSETTTQPFGNLVNGYLLKLKELTSISRSEGCVINEVRRDWLLGEDFLTSQAKDLGFTYIPINRDNLTEKLNINEVGKFFYKEFAFPISVLRGRGFSDIISGDVLLSLVNSVVNKELWIEIPINYIYRQKWPMALPFHPDFKYMFSDRLRNILAPTITIHHTSLDFSPIIEYFPYNYREKLMSVSEVGNLLSLPESIRRMLIFKNSNSTGDLHNRGRGVFRLTGSQGYVKHILAQIIESIENKNQFWIIQPYISRKYSVPFLDGEVHYQKICNSRFMLFGERNGCSWSAQGALANFSKNWKVTGSNETSLVSVRICS